MIAQQERTKTVDIFGPPVNMCAKINHYALQNSMVIGGDLYQMVKSFPSYKFRSGPAFSTGLRLEYPIYAVLRSN